MFTKKLTYSLVIIILIFTILLLQKKINLIRNERRDIVRYDLSEMAPILLFGGFRAIAIDLLWIRGIAKHQEKQYYETMAINNLISKLQPDFPDVWTFQAWNMAYNIAYEWKGFENKWKWIKAGIEFAKKGAVKNPSNADIAFELGYMYLHLFNAKYFKHAEFCRERLKEEYNEDNYDEAVYWLKKSNKFESKIFNKSVMQRMVCHALWQAALQAEKDGRLKDALDYITKSIGEWDAYKGNFPDDPLAKSSEFLPLIEQKRGEIKARLENR